ncbi:MAG: DUF1549 domain-containing protein, partial [Planctomycetaceae bacterium]
GRHWLDKARYADSDGYEKDRPRPTAWTYRDWVIHAINEDMPFDQFTVQQLAGDLLPKERMKAEGGRLKADNASKQNVPPSDRLIATAFHRQTLTNTEGGVDKEQFRVEAIFDRVATTGSVWLGLTVGCAQCHSHKYDQISQTEYYQLFAFFNNGDETTIDIPLGEEAVREYERQTAEHDQKLAALENELASLKSANATPDSITKLEQRIEKLKKAAPKPPVMTVDVLTQRASDPRTTRLLRRGDFLQPQGEVQPGTLAVLHDFEPRDPSAAPDRLDLALWLVDPDNPLTPRVAVNHVWSHLFGRGLVKTPGDFGTRGEKPTHPLLLDWLASEFVGNAECGVRNAELKGRFDPQGDHGIRPRRGPFRTPHSALHISA